MRVQDCPTGVRAWGWVAVCQLGLSPKIDYEENKTRGSSGIPTVSSTVRGGMAVFIRQLPKGAGPG
jgi:hypothetical protein